MKTLERTIETLKNGDDIDKDILIYLKMYQMRQREQPVEFDMENLTAHCQCGNIVDPRMNYCYSCGSKLGWNMNKWNELIERYNNLKRTGKIK